MQSSTQVPELAWAQTPSIVVHAMTLMQHSPGLLHWPLEVQAATAALELDEVVVVVVVVEVVVVVVVEVVLVVVVVVLLVVVLLVVVPPPVPVVVGEPPPKSVSSPSAQLARPSPKRHAIPPVSRNALAPRPKVLRMGVG